MEFSVIGHPLPVGSRVESEFRLDGGHALAERLAAIEAHVGLGDAGEEVIADD